MFSELVPTGLVKNNPDKLVIVTLRIPPYVPILKKALATLVEKSMQATELVGRGGILSSLL